MQENDVSPESKEVVTAVFIGEQSVGKTKIITKFYNKVYDEKPTLGQNCLQ